MASPNLCGCGCLRPCSGAFAPRHDSRKLTRKSSVDYKIEDRGYSTPCWIWQLKISRFGYGCIKVNRVDMHAHRYYYEQYRGTIPATIDGQRAESDHLCRVRECVNPEHLELVGQTTNIRRGMVAKLTDEQAASIPQRYSAGESQCQIARSLGIGQVQVSRILNGLRRAGGVIVACRRDQNLKLSPEQVSELRRRAKAGEGRKSLVQSFGIGMSQISRIIRNQAWPSAAMKA